MYPRTIPEGSTNGRPVAAATRRSGARILRPCAALGLPPDMAESQDTSQDTRPTARCPRAATASIATRAAAGSFATCTVARAGCGAGR